METSTQNNPQLKNIRDIPKLETYTKFNLTVLIILRVNRVDIYDRKKDCKGNNFQYSPACLEVEFLQCSIGILHSVLSRSICR